MNDEIEHVQDRFRRFADLECKEYSDHYYRLAHGVAADGELVRFIAEMPDQQPNLFFASVQYLTGAEAVPASGVELRSFVKQRGRDVAVSWTPLLRGNGLDSGRVRPRRWTTSEL